MGSAVERVLAVAVAAGVGFVDPQFPPSDASVAGGARSPALPWDSEHRVITPPMLGQSPIPPSRPLHGARRPCSWLRAADLVPAADLVSAVTAHGVVTYRVPGRFGCDALCAAAAALAEVGADGADELTALFDTSRMHPPQPEEEAEREQAAGAVRVQLCPEGWWEWVLVDDWLPAQDGTHRAPYGVRPRAPQIAPQALWPCFLDQRPRCKAVAKARGGYSRAAEGPLGWHLHCLTGDPCCTLDWDDD
eukprot:gene33864-65138_t